MLAIIRLWLVPSTILHWPDRRPIGVLFLASHYHSSATNPRGWFNEPSLNFTGTNGVENFRKALMEYTDRSLEILKRTGAQGVIVWDLEGEQYPHKTTFIGDSDNKPAAPTTVVLSPNDDYMQQFAGHGR